MIEQQSCQVDLGKNPYQDHKKSQDSHFFLKKSQGVPRCKADPMHLQISGSNQYLQDKDLIYIF